MAEALSEKRKSIYDEAKDSVKDFKTKGKFKSSSGESFLKLIGLDDGDDIKAFMKVIKSKDDWQEDDLLTSLLDFLKNKDQDDNDAELREVFEAFDEDNSGFISIDELCSALAKLGQECGREEIEEMVLGLSESGKDQEREGMEVTFKGFKKLME